MSDQAPDADGPAPALSPAEHAILDVLEGIVTVLAIGSPTGIGRLAVELTRRAMAVNAPQPMTPDQFQRWAPVHIIAGRAWQLAGYAAAQPEAEQPVVSDIEANVLRFPAPRPTGDDGGGDSAA